MTAEWREAETIMENEGKSGRIAKQEQGVWIWHVYVVAINLPLPFRRRLTSGLALWLRLVSDVQTIMICTLPDKCYPFWLDVNNFFDCYKEKVLGGDLFDRLRETIRHLLPDTSYKGELIQIFCPIFHLFFASIQIKNLPVLRSPHASQNVLTSSKPSSFGTFGHRFDLSYYCFCGMYLPVFSNKSVFHEGERGTTMTLTYIWFVTNAYHR